MRTGELIRAMAADTAPRRPVGPVLAATMAGLALVVGAVALAVLGPNPDLGAMMTGPLMLLRQAFPLLLALGAALLALRLASPGAGSGPTRLMLVAAAALAAGIVLRELALVPAADWGRAAMGGTARACLAVGEPDRPAAARRRALGARAGRADAACARPAPSPGCSPERSRRRSTRCTAPRPARCSTPPGTASRCSPSPCSAPPLGPRVLRW